MNDSAGSDLCGGGQEGRMTHFAARQSELKRRGQHSKSVVRRTYYVVMALLDQ